MAGRGATRGIVYLVGAGPGDPRLITVAGLEAIQSSDVIVYDRLVNHTLLEEAPAEAERILAGKRPGGHAVAQAAIDAILIDRARAGLTVTRLKGGDPFVFGRGGEECEALRAAGVPYVVIPGVTSAIAVPGLAGIPVTHRRYSSAFAVVTGHQCEEPSTVDWSALARIPTLVVLMGLATLARTAERLIAAGVPGSRPAAVVASGTLPHERAVIGTLETIARQARDAAIASPAVLIVGEVVRLRETLGTPRRGPAVASPDSGTGAVLARAPAGAGRVSTL
jgi:uroporphyrin-III C-methyltransferase